MERQVTINIATQLQSALGEVGVTQAKFARATGFNQQALNDILHGRRVGMPVSLAVALEDYGIYTAEYWLGLKMQQDIVEYRAEQKKKQLVTQADSSLQTV